jgi:uncharacterized protein (TIGR02996 family)
MSTITLNSLDEAKQHARSNPCPGCEKRGTLSAYTVRKEGPNTGRLFMSCGACGKFVWLSGSGASAKPKPKAAPVECPAPSQTQSEEAGLLDDIASNAAEDGPRLIYADWLEDQGGSARAEFVRLGVALDRAKDAAAQARYQELLDRNGWCWFGTVMEHAAAWHLAGGLVDGVTISAQAFAARAPALLRDAPAAEWRITFASWSELKTFTSCPEFARVRRLTLEGCYLGGDGVRIVTACPRVAGLRSLSLYGLGIGQPGVRSLAMSAYLGELRDLDLGENNLSGSAVAILASSPNLPKLRRLSLCRNALTDSDVRSLTNSRYLKELTDLDLSRNGLTNESADALAASPLLSRLRRLDVRDGISLSGAYRIRHSPHARADLELLY